MDMDNHPDGVLVKVKVKPHSNHFRIKRERKGLVLEVKSPPIKGKANREIKEEFQKNWGKEVEILKGFRSKNKIILIKKARIEEIEGYLK